MLAAWVSTEVEAKFLDAVAAEDFEVATPNGPEKRVSVGQTAFSDLHQR